MRRFELNDNDGGQRLDKFVTKTLKGLPPSLMYKYIRTKRIKVNGKRAVQNQMLASGDVVEMYIPDEFFTGDTDASEFSKVTPKLSIIYEDKNILLCDKKPGVLAHTGDEHENDTKSIAARETLIFQIQAYLYQRGEYEPSDEASFAPALCNRIDRNTGGIVIAAKNAAALRDMNEMIRRDMIDKYYLCAVHGRTRNSERLEGYLFKNTKTKTVTVSERETRGSKKIITEYTQLAYNNERDLSLLKVRLVTGRTHQIRAHMNSVGHPLLGEGKYGVNRDDRRLGYAHQALYAYSVRFTGAVGTLGYLSGRQYTAEADNIRFLEFFGGTGILK